MVLRTRQDWTERAQMHAAARTNGLVAEASQADCRVAASPRHDGLDPSDALSGDPTTLRGAASGQFGDISSRENG
jgi:hypothetical protein